MEEHVNVTTDHSEPAFFSDGLTISHGPQKFVMDFTQTTPRFDNIRDTRQQSFTIKHKTILLDPLMVKEVFRVLKENIEKYEKLYGEIKAPKAAKKKETKKVAGSSASYIG